MDISDSLYVGVITVFFAVSLIGLALLGAPEEARGAVNATEQLLGDAAGSGSRQPVDRWTTVCLGSGCIPAVDTPQYVDASAADWLEAGDQVLAVTVDGRAVAFPLDILQFHGVVNTRIGTTPVAATYSPYSGVPAAFHRSVAGRVRSFEHSGKLYNGNMVMQDRSTGTRWSQFTGRPVDSMAAGARLQRVDASVARWGIWQENHPDGDVMTRHTGVFDPSRYQDRPYFGYHRSRSVPVEGVSFSRHPKRAVYGIARGDAAVAYRVAHLRAENLVEDVVDGTPVLVVQDEDRDRFLAFNRSVGGQSLSFTRGNGTLQDTATGSTWTMEGDAIEGPLRGARLQRVPLTRSYWYTWKLFHPDTRLHHPPG